MQNMYIVFSSTPFKVGRMIRAFTGEEYNHVSIMFDYEFNEAYSFGREHIDTPFYGGLIKDSISRYKHKNKKAYINVCKIAVDDESYLKALLTVRRMYENKSSYVYNLFSAAVALFHRKWLISNAFTCVEFCTYVLGMVTDKIDTNRFYSVEGLLDVFKENSIYEGEFNFAGAEDKEYKKHHGRRAAVKVTANAVLELIKRMRKI